MFPRLENRDAPLLARAPFFLVSRLFRDPDHRREIADEKHTHGMTIRRSVHSGSELRDLICSKTRFYYKSNSKSTRTGTPRYIFPHRFARTDESELPPPRASSE